MIQARWPARKLTSPAVKAASLLPSRATSPAPPRARARWAGRSRPAISTGISSGLVSQRRRPCPVTASSASAAARAANTGVARRAMSGR